MSELQRADLLRFENRLKEILKGAEPIQQRWRDWLAISTGLAILGFSLIYNDYKFYQDRNIIHHICNRPFSSIAITVWFVLMIVFKAGVRVRAKYILVERTRKVLGHYDLTCNEIGDLGICFFPDEVCPPIEEEFCPVCEEFWDDEDGDSWRDAMSANF